MNQYLENKILKTLTGYIKENFEDIYPKKYIYLNDYLECIPSKKHNNDLTKIYDESPEYYYFLHEKVIKVYIKVKKEVHEKNKNALIIMRGENMLLKSFEPYLTRIDPNKLIEHYCRGNRIRGNFNVLKHLVWDSLDFIKENIGVYGEIRELSNKHYIEILFQKIIKENEDSIEFLKIFLNNGGKILEIFENLRLTDLKEKIESYLNIIFPESLLNIINKCISLNSFAELFSLLLLISYLKQFDVELKNFEQAFKFLNEKLKIIQKLDKKTDILPLHKDLEKIGEISDLFLESFIINQQEELFLLFNYPRMIKEIEEKINFIEDFSTNKAALNLPSISTIDENIIKVIYNIRFSFSFISYFTGTILEMLTRIMNDEGFTPKLILKTSFIFKAIDQFKKNLFFRIGDEGAEYWIKLRFLENYCKNIFYLYHLINEVIPDLGNIKDDNEDWKIIFEKFYLPLNRCLEGNIDTTSQFIQSGAFNIDNFAKILENKTIESIELINNYFINYVRENYKDWVSRPDLPSTPLSVINVFKRLLFPGFSYNPKDPKKYYLILLIDCCHLGLWHLLKQRIMIDFPELHINTHVGFSILPTKTKFAREALFSGNYPKDFSHKGEFQAFLKLLEANKFRRYGKITADTISDHFITNCENIFDFKRAINKVKAPDINFQICIFNFSDQVSHTFSQTFLRRMVESIYNTKIRPLIELIVRLKEKEFLIFFATDHGTSRCTQRFIWGDDRFDYFYFKRDQFETTSPRTFISYDLPSTISKIEKKLIAIKMNEAEKWGLKSSKTLRMVKNDGPGFDTITKNFNYFFAANYQNLTFTRYSNRDPQNFGHGGITMDEYIIPFAKIKRKNEDYEEFNRKIDVDFKLDVLEEDFENSELNIIIKNNSNKEIKFKKGHIITNWIHYKFIKYKDFTIKINAEKTIIQLKLPLKFYQGEIIFHFTYYQDEKLERSKKFKYIIE